MGFKKEHSNESIYIKMENALSIYDVAELRSEVVACLQENPSLILDLEKVTECDTAGLQFLYAASKFAGHAEKQLVFENIPAVVNEALSLTGMASDWLSDARKEA